MAICREPLECPGCRDTQDDFEITITGLTFSTLRYRSHSTTRVGNSILVYVPASMPKEMHVGLHVANFEAHALWVISTYTDDRQNGASLPSYRSGPMRSLTRGRKAEKCLFWVIQILWLVQPLQEISDVLVTLPDILPVA
ncbi:uncharacterized protein BT62DRAFT_924122 [Guyanagaster necrorhizus]|uniref:Uncharacterized protein n=1 Tax=Guyanagaster necrorhizus TaxID=856835 RepID=A0A9P7VH92_9AGAR|nr:uncharacterized protein BT62DRAFT_924122 [Guyanagaster necrorhizus MCA 3950]KAG7440340.1 hypothetical protein BT62DRAFT_924122 [Guyanagaster necrorhizus MCA 3950]